MTRDCRRTTKGLCTLDSQSSSSLYHYIAVRKDLPRGLLAAQVCHAAGESSPGNLPVGTHAVILGLTASELAALLARLQHAQVPCQAIVENDQPYQDQLLAIGLKPAPRAAVAAYVSQLPLLKEAANG